ncbi:MAG: SLC45 family MFS transporter [Ruminococcaceae bacterium]|nr:SLC45 family MFS transporter [Oscillospiraceae bacterium]
MKLNYKRTILIGFAFMSILAFWQFYDQVIPYVLEKVFGLKTLFANSIMAIDNVLAIFMLPLFGAISDRTNTKLGKRTPYILFGTIAAVILLVLLGLFEESVHFLGFMITLFLLLVTMAVYRTPAVAYMPDVTEKSLRSKANAIINLVGYIGGIFATVVMMFMLKSEKNSEGEKVYSADQSFLPVFIVIAIFMLVSVLIMVLSIKENKLPHVVGQEEKVEKNQQKLSKPVFKSLVLILASVFLWFMAYNAVTTAFSRYCVNVWKTDLGTSSSYLLVATIAAIAAFVPLGFLSSAVGRKKTVLIGILLMTVCYAVAIFIKHQTPIMYAIFGLVGIGWAAINVNSYPMVVEMSNGSDVGKYTGFYYTFSMAAQITTPLLSGLLIDELGWGYSILFPYAVVFSILSFTTMLFVKHGDSKPIAKKDLLENFDLED